MPDFSSGPVSSVAVSPDSRLIAAAANEAELAIAPLRRPLAGVDAYLSVSGEGRLAAATPQVSCLCFPGPSTVYTATTSGSFSRYRVSETKAPVSEYDVSDAHGNGVGLTGIAAVTAESIIATSGKDSVVRVFDPETRQCITRLTGHKYEVRGVAVAQSIGGGDASDTESVHIVATAGRDKTARIFDVRASSSSPIHVFTGHTGWVHDVAISGGGPGRPHPALVTCAGDKTVRVWNLAMMKEELVFSGHEYRVWGVAVSPDATFAVSGSTDATVRAWNLAAVAPADKDEDCRVFQGHRDSVVSVAVSRDGNLSVSGCEDGSMLVWDTSTLFGRSCVPDTNASAGLSSAAACDSAEEPVAKEGNISLEPEKTSRPATQDELTDAVAPEANPPTTPVPAGVSEDVVLVDSTAAVEDGDFGVEKRNSGTMDFFDSLAADLNAKPVSAEPIDGVPLTLTGAKDETPVVASERPPLIEADLLGLGDAIADDRTGEGRSGEGKTSPLAQDEEIESSIADCRAQDEKTGSCIAGPQPASDSHLTDDADSTPYPGIEALNERLTALSKRLDALLAVEVS